jgi:hypothetical protein
MQAIEIKVPVKMAKNECSDHYDIMKKYGHDTERFQAHLGKVLPLWG